MKTTAEQYPGPYTKNYCIKNRISIGPITEEWQHEKLCSHFGCTLFFVPGYYYRFYPLYNKRAFSWQALNTFGSYFTGSHDTMCNHEITFDEFDFEEFKVPEKICVAYSEDALEWIRKKAEVNGYCISKMDYYFFPQNEYKNNSGYSVPKGYTLLTNEQFYKYILKKPLPTMEKKIIGYKAPMDLFGGDVKKGSIFTKTAKSNHWYCSPQAMDSYCQMAPSEIVETWEPVYAPTSKTITVVPGLEVRVEDGKVYHKNDDITEFVKGMFGSIGERTLGGYKLRVKRIEFDWTGCFKQPSNTDNWLPVLEAINQFKK